MIIIPQINVIAIHVMNVIIVQQQNRRFLMSFEMIPDRLMDGTKRYVEGHIKPGSFLTAVIQNNLTEALGRADDESRLLLHDIVKWFYNEAPFTCWGSPEKMSAWLALREL